MLDMMIIENGGEYQNKSEKYLIFVLLIVKCIFKKKSLLSLYLVINDVI